MNQPPESQPESPEEGVAPSAESDAPKPARKRRAAAKLAPVEGEVATTADEPAAAPKPRRRKAAAAVDAPAGIDVAAARAHDETLERGDPVGAERPLSAAAGAGDQIVEGLAEGRRRGILGEGVDRPCLQAGVVVIEPGGAGGPPVHVVHVCLGRDRPAQAGA